MHFDYRFFHYICKTGFTVFLKPGSNPSLHHSVNVLAKYGARPYQHPVTMLTPFIYICVCNQNSEDKPSMIDNVLNAYS